MKLKDVELEAMRLPADDREILAVQLLKSITPSTNEEIEQSWIQEAQRRLEEFDRNPSTGTPASQVHDQIKKEFGWS